MERWIFLTSHFSAEEKFDVVTDRTLPLLNALSNALSGALSVFEPFRSVRFHNLRMVAIHWPLNRSVFGA